MALVAFASPSLQAANVEVTIDQQSRRVTGSVKDAQGEPLLGVNVLERGTTNGTITDLDGNFTLEVSANASLVFSYIGYTSQTIAVTGNTLNVVMHEDMQALSEVVVVGYGTQQKKDITGSVAVVDTKELLKSSGSSAAQQLQGRASGVYVGQTGSPGSSTNVRIRGINTVNDNGPLYVIDGVSTRNQNLSTINPNDIESLQVLKDASSAAIYGAQAANGVILITTKKGTKTGQPVLTYDGYYGIQKQTRRYDVLGSDDRLNLEWAAKASSYKISGVTDRDPSHVQFGTGATPVIPNYMTQSGAGGSQSIDPNDYSYPDNTMVPYSNTNWWDEVDQVAPVQSHQVSISGGSDKGQYMMSAGYLDQQGTIIESYYKRYTVRANSSFNVRPWLRFGQSFSYAWTKDQGLRSSTGEDSAYSWSYRSSPWVPVYDIQGHFAGSKIAGTGNWQNTVAQQIRGKDNYYSNSRVFGNVWGEADLYKGLLFRTSFGMDYTNSHSYRMNKKNLEFSETSGQNSLREETNFNFRWVWTNTLSYKATYNDVHALNVLLGTEAIRDGLGRQLIGERFNYLYEDNIDTWVLNMGENNTQRIAESSYKGQFALFGIFGRVDYAFMDKYLFTGIMRRDGVSRFSQSNRYGTFPSVSLGWRISEESFMEGTRDWLDDLKIRVGYGQTGNAEIPRITNYASEFTTDPSNSNYDINGGNTSTTGYRLRRYGNAETKWEAIETTNIGLDATFLGGKFAFSGEFYLKKTSDMLIEAQYSYLANDEIGKPYINYGDMKNTGFDLTFNYRDSYGDWNWDVSANLSHYKNEVVRLSQADNASIFRSGARISGNVTRTTMGQPISMFYGYKTNGFYENEADVLAAIPLGQDKNAPEFVPQRWVGKFKFQDMDNDGMLTTADQTYIGNPHPDLLAGLNANVGYKNFDFTMFWYSSIGNDIFNNTKYFTDFWLFEGNRSSRMHDLSWTPGGDNSKAILPVLDYSDGYSGTNSNSYYVEDGSFLKLKNVILGYTFPKEWLQKATISNLRVYVQAENCLTFTKYTGLDPEVTVADTDQGDQADLRRGLDMGGWPTPMKLLFGVNFAF